MAERIRVSLRRNDRIMLEMSCHFGFLTTEHCAKWIYKTSIRYARRRLHQLRRAGYLRFVARRDRIGLMKVYIPCLPNLRGEIDDAVIERGEKARTAHVRFRSQTEHEDAVRDLAINLQLAFPETRVDLDFMYLKSELSSQTSKGGGNGRFPDVTLRRWQKSDIAFEVELTQKSQERYFKKLLDAFAHPQRPTVYVVWDLSIGQMVLKQRENVLRTLRRRNQLPQSEVLVVSYEDLHSKEMIQKFIEELEHKRLVPGMVPDVLGKVPTEIENEHMELKR